MVFCFFVCLFRWFSHETITSRILWNISYKLLKILPLSAVLLIHPTPGALSFCLCCNDSRCKVFFIAFIANWAFCFNLRSVPRQSNSWRKEPEIPYSVGSLGCVALEVIFHQSVSILYKFSLIFNTASIHFNRCLLVL